MAKKKKNEGHRNSNGTGRGGESAAITSFFEGALAEGQVKLMAEGMERVRLNSEMPLTVLAREIRKGLHQNGTNVIMNDNDPMGDGDQSAIEGKRQRDFHEELFTTGGDLYNCIDPVNTLSPFANAVLTGNVPVVRAMLKEADTSSTTGDGTPSKDLVALLETRETSMRLSPILMVVSLGKNLVEPGMVPGRAANDPHVAVAKLLLRYGARPDARDVVGKTVFHYGAGALATPMSLTVADLCLRAQEGGSHLFGKKVTLVNLSNEAMNGKEGIALGFDVDTGRRAVSLPPDGESDRRKVVAVKPENLRLSSAHEQEEMGSRPFVRLCDVQDRLGSVSFIEVIFQDRVDVAKFLLERKAKLDIVNLEGNSPLSTAMMQGAQLSSQVCRLINEHASATARRERRKLCSGCGKDEKDAAATFNLCAGCKSMRYCSRDCQLQHWKASHKLECRAIQGRKKDRVVLERPPAGVGYSSFISVRSGPPISNGDSYKIPRDVRTGQKFTIKVQASGTRESGSLLIYNEARDCSFFLKAGQGGFTELYDVVRAEKATGGTKTYMKAMFDEDGNCVAFPGDTTIHTW